MKIWIFINGVQNGPYNLEQLKELPVTENTPVWHEGMSDWMPAAKAPATASLFNGIEENLTITESEQNNTVECAEDNGLDAELEELEEVPSAAESVETQQESEKQGVDEVEGYEAAQEDVTVETMLTDRKRIRKEYPAFLPWSIVLTCCCCTPTAVAGIITGAITIKKRNSGKFEAARKLSNITEWLVIISITLGVMSIPFLMVL